MANLVAPVNILQTTQDRIIEFQGLNRKPFVDEGEMSAMHNLTSDRYPLLATRRKRGEYALPNGVVNPLYISTRFERIALIGEKADGSIAFYYNQTEVEEVTGLTADTKIVAINNKLCFFPQKTYVEIVRTGSVVNIGEFGTLEERYQIPQSIDISLSTDGAVITLTESKFKYDDAITIDGTLSYKDKSGTNKTTAFTTSVIIKSVEGSKITVAKETFLQLIGEGATAITFIGTLERTMPELEHVIEWNNRLWGVSSKDNTIYACKLGDPTNWQFFMGTGMDSYYAQQGTDEDWTGSAAYSGHLLFFKQNSMSKIYGSSPANYQIANMQCYGVEQGSSKSVAVVNDRVFYKSTIGIMAYDGGVPYTISEKFAGMKFRNVVSGTEGIKYYASIEKENGEYELLVLDIDKAVWHREDSVRFKGSTTLDGRLYFINGSTSGSCVPNRVYIINPETETESALSWSATFGPFDEYVENRKIYSRVLLRLKSFDSLSVFISMNEGEWELVKTFDGPHTGGEVIPIVPRRCDRYSIKIEGVGNCEVKSLTRKIRLGTGGKL